MAIHLKIAADRVLEKFRKMLMIYGDDLICNEASEIAIQNLLDKSIEDLSEAKEFIADKYAAKE